MDDLASFWPLLLDSCKTLLALTLGAEIALVGEERKDQRAIKRDALGKMWIAAVEIRGGLSVTQAHYAEPEKWRELFGPFMSKHARPEEIIPVFGALKDLTFYASFYGSGGVQGIVERLDPLVYVHFTNVARFAVAQGQGKNADSPDASEAIRLIDELLELLKTEARFDLGGRRLLRLFS